MALLGGRLAAFLLATLAVLALSWLALYVPTAWTELDVGGFTLLLPYLSLLGVLAFFGSLALLLSLLLPSRRMTAMAAGMLLVGSYFLDALARIAPDMTSLARLSPLYYYQGGQAMESFNLAWFVGLLAASALFALLAAWRFQRRDTGGAPSRAGTNGSDALRHKSYGSHIVRCGSHISCSTVANPVASVKQRILSTSVLTMNQAVFCDDARLLFPKMCLQSLNG